MMDTAMRSQLLSASGALRSVMSKLDAADKLTAGSDGLKKFISIFREKNSINVISVLSFGARNENRDLRLSSVLLLGNVIDNRFVCVPLVQLNDPDLVSTDYGINGRANLLGVISVVAPWAYAENFSSIRKTREIISTQVNRDDPKFKGTVNILDNIQNRLSSQTDDSNKGVPLDKAMTEACRKYALAYVPKLNMGGLNY